MSTEKFETNSVNTGKKSKLLHKYLNIVEYTGSLRILFGLTALAKV